MRRTAGIMLGLSVVGCQGLQPMPREHQYVQVIPMGTPSSFAPGGAMPMQPGVPGMLPPVAAPQLPQAGTVSQPRIFPQPMPNLPGEPPLAPTGPSTMGTMDPNVIAAMIQARAAKDDSETKRLQMELTKEMCQQIMLLRQKVAELSAEQHSRAEVGQTKPVSVSQTDVEGEKPKPAPKSESHEPKLAPVSHKEVKPEPKEPAPITAAVLSQEEIAARNLQMDLTRELGRQVIDLKQKVGDLRGDVETWAEAGRERREKDMQKEVVDLRIEIAELQSEMTKLKAPEKGCEKSGDKAPTAPKSSAFPDLSVPPPEEAAPIVPLPPSSRSKSKSPLRESSPMPKSDYNKRFADALSEIRADLDELKSCFVEQIVRADLALVDSESDFE